MKKLLLWLFGGAAGLAVLIFAAVLFVPRFIDVEKYIKPQLERRISQATGRDISLGKDFHLKVFPWVGVSFRNLMIGNSQNNSSEKFVKVRSFEARIRVLPLLTGNIEVKKFVLDGPEITLVRQADGSNNWTFGRKKTRPPGKREAGRAEMQPGTVHERSHLQSLDVGEFSITNGKIRYEDRSVGHTREVENINLALENLSLDKKIAVDLQAMIDGKPVVLDGTFGPIGVDPAKGNIDFFLSLALFEELHLELQGKVSDIAQQQNFKLSVTAEPFSLKKLMAAFGQRLPFAARDETVFEKLAFVSTLHGNGDQVIIEQGVVQLDQTTIQFAGSSGINPTRVIFSAEIDTLDLDRYLPESKEIDPGTGRNTAAKEAKEAKEKQAVAEGGSRSEEVLPSPALDYGPFRNLDVEGTLRLGSLVVHGAKMSQVALDMTGKKGIFNVRPLKISMYEGALAIDAQIDVQGLRPKSAVDIKVNNIMMGPLLRDSMGKDILEGRLSAELQLVTLGDQASQIRKSLDGEGKMTFIDGALVGIDIADMARSLASGLGVEKPREKPRTDFAELGVPFTITKGVFTTTDASLISPLLRVRVAGSADLATEKLDLKVKPKLVATLKGQGDVEQRQGVTIPIAVGGTFTDPKYSADLAGLSSEEALQQAIKDPEGTAEKVKSVRDEGKKLLEGLLD